MTKHESNLKNLIKISEEFHRATESLFGQGSNEEKYVKKDIELSEDIRNQFKKHEGLENGTGYKDGEVIDLQRNALFDLIEGLTDVTESHGIYDDFEKLPTGQYRQDGEIHEYKSRFAEGFAKLAGKLNQRIFDGEIPEKKDKGEPISSEELDELLRRPWKGEINVPRGIGKVPFLDDMEFTGFEPGKVAHLEPIFVNHYTGMKTSHFYDIYGKDSNYSTPRYAPRTLSAYTVLHHIIHNDAILNYDMEMDLRGRYRRITGYDFNESADWSYEALTQTKIPLHYVVTYRNSRMLFLLTLGFTTALSDPMLKRIFLYSIEYNNIIPKTKSDIERQMEHVRNTVKPVKYVPSVVIWDSISTYQSPKSNPLRGCSYPKNAKKWGAR